MRNSAVHPIQSQNSAGIAMCGMRSTWNQPRKIRGGASTVKSVYQVKQGGAQQVARYHSQPLPPLKVLPPAVRYT